MSQESSVLTTGSVDREAVMAALDTVRDPELDESVVALDFVASVDIDGADVEVALRLPTYFCAANFAWLMVADAREALEAVEGVGRVEVTLPDHYASEEITGGVNGHDGFDDAFTGEGDGGGLDDLRLTFRRKAFLSRQYRLLRELLDQGRSRSDLVGLTLGEVAEIPERELYLQRRAELGLGASDDAVIVVDEDGNPIGEDRIDDHLVWIRTVSVSIDGNAAACRGLLAARYGLELPAEGVGGIVTGPSVGGPAPVTIRSRHHQTLA